MEQRCIEKEFEQFCNNEAFLPDDLEFLYCNPYGRLISFFQVPLHSASKDFCLRLCVHNLSDYPIRLKKNFEQRNHGTDSSHDLDAQRITNGSYRSFPLLYESLAFYLIYLIF